MLNSGEISNFIQKKDFAVNIIETAKVIILVLDSKGFILYFNPFMEELTGYSLEDMKGKEWFSAFLPEKDREDIKKIFLIAIEDMDVRGNVNTIITSKGQELYIEWYSKTLKDKNGRSAGLLNIGYDVTERKKLEENMSFLEYSMENSSMATFWIDSSGKLFNVNMRACKTLGYSQEELKNMNVSDLDPFFPEHLWPEHWRELKEKGVLIFNSFHRRKDGSLFPVEITANYLKFRDEEYNFAFAFDITERKKIESELEKYREKLEEMVKERTEELERKSLELNERVKEISCLYSATRLLSEPDKDLGEILKETVEILPSGFQYPSLTYIRIVIDNMEFKSSNFRDASLKMNFPVTVFGKEAGFFEIYCDEPFLKEEYTLIDNLSGKTGRIIEKRKTEYALWASELKHRILLEHIPQKIFHKDRDLNYIYCNDNYAADLKIKPEEIVGKNDYDFYPSDLAEKYRFDDRKIMEEGKTVELEEKYVKNGQDFYVNTVKTPTRDKNGEITGLFGIFWDITEKKEAEENLKKTMEELTRSNYDLEQFAYVASHDLQEPLRKISSFTELLDRKYKDRLDEKAQKYMFYIVDGAKRMQSLINDLLMFSRAGRGDMGFEKINMKEILDDILTDLQPLIKKENARIVVEHLPFLTGNTLQLHQVMQNLIVNAIKFHSKNPPLIQVFSKENEQEWVISVRDNGIGIENQYLERIFGVFQRLHTKEKYEGSGIGLSICKKIVERHGGHMMVDSIYGEGSTFSFTIPKR